MMNAMIAEHELEVWMNCLANIVDGMRRHTGVGNKWFKVGARKKIKFVDSQYSGCWGLEWSAERVGKNEQGCLG